MIKNSNIFPLNVFGLQLSIVIVTVIAPNNPIMNLELIGATPFAEILDIVPLNVAGDDGNNSPPVIVIVQGTLV